MESFYFQLACLVGVLALVGFWIYRSKKQVSEISEVLLDKQIVINELAEHYRRMDQEASSVVEIRPLKSTKKRATKTDKTVKPKKEKVVKSKTTTKTKK
jgi:Tfp pilus assembly protein PilN